MRFIVIGGGCYGLYHSGQLYKAIQKGKLPPDTKLIIVDRNEMPKVRQTHGTNPNYVFIQSDWQNFLRNFLADLAQYNPATDGDEVQIVPAPFAPHLYFDWLQFAVAEKLHSLSRPDITVERDGFDEKMGLPYEHTNQTGNHYISRAGWTCPAACVEPRLCPAVKGLRDWDLKEDVEAVVAGRPLKASVSGATALQAAKLPNGGEAIINSAGYAGAELFTVYHFTHGIGTIPARRLYEARDNIVAAALKLDSAHPVARFAVGTVSHCHGVIATLKVSL